MKRFFCVIFCFYSALQAAVGCMDNSYHADPCVAYDYKNYHYVCCSCRCARYAHSLNRGMCRRCGHYRVPVENEFKISWPQPKVGNGKSCKRKCNFKSKKG